MTTKCDKRDCEKDNSYIVNAKMYKLELSGCVQYPSTEEYPDKPISGHLCYKHRKELAKIIDKYLGGIKNEK